MKSLRSTTPEVHTEALRMPTSREALTELFMRTMEFYHWHRDLALTPEMTTLLSAMQAVQPSQCHAMLSMAVDAIARDLAGNDPAVRVALAQARIVLLGGTR